MYRISAPKALLDSSKDIILIMELYKLHENGKLGSKTQTLHVWNDYFKLAVKYYLGVLPHVLSYYV